MIDRELSEAKEHFEATEKHLKLLQLDSAKLGFRLGVTKDKLRHSKSLQLVQLVQVHEKKIKDLEGMIFDLMGRINEAKSRLQSIKEKNESPYKEFLRAIHKTEEFTREEVQATTYFEATRGVYKWSCSGRIPSPTSSTRERNGTH